MKAMDIITLVLLIVGGLNWGLVGLFDWNLVAAIFGVDTFVSDFIYVLVGLSAVYQAAAWRGMQQRWAWRPAHET